MNTPSGFRLRDADATLRIFLTSFLLVASTGYTIGLLFVEHRTGYSPAGIRSQFLGTAESAREEEMSFEKSPAEMFVFLHNHILGISLLLGCVGGIFYFTSLVPEWLRRLLLVEPMGAVFTTFAGIALVRFVSPVFVWLVLVSGITMVAGYAAMVLLILTELWLPRCNLSRPGSLAPRRRKGYLECGQNGHEEPRHAE
jgi:hypothetical protein